MVGNFVSISAIAQFDNYFYQMLGKDPFKKLIDDGSKQLNLVIRCTTSRLDTEDVQIKVTKALEVPRRVSFSSRTLQIKGIYLFYKISKWFYLCVWYYFLPLTVIFASFYIPYQVQMAHTAADAAGHH